MSKGQFILGGVLTGIIYFLAKENYSTGIEITSVDWKSKTVSFKISYGGQSIIEKDFKLGDTKVFTPPNNFYEFEANSLQDGSLIISVWQNRPSKLLLSKEVNFTTQKINDLKSVAV